MSAGKEAISLVVIGGGPGGYAAAFKAADLGMKVTLIDADVNPGGVCLYRGCIPSKALLHVAKLLVETKHSANLGVDFGTPKIDLDKLRAWKDSVVAKMTGGLGLLAKSRKVTMVQGRATFLDAHTVLVARADGKSEKISFDYAILATGSRPTVIPTFPKHPRVMDSTGALELPEIPASLLVVGGGYIGLELGTVYAALGSQVTVVEMTPTLLAGADRDLVEILEKKLRGRFTKILTETKVAGLVASDTGVEATLQPPKGDAIKQTFTRVLVAIGRRPNSADLGLEKTKVKVNAKGFVEIDAQRRTAEPSIFAIGDVAGEPMLAHKASHEGIVAVEAIHGSKATFAPAAIPGVVFTDPELAWAGLTETQAAAQGIKVTVGKFPWGASGRATTVDAPAGLTKLLLDSETGRVLGMGIVGAGAGELISEGVLAIEMAANAEDLKLTIHPHPTLSETVMEAAEMFFGSTTHLYRPPKKA